jgi:hypothetical protein
VGRIKSAIAFDTTVVAKSGRANGLIGKNLIFFLKKPRCCAGRGHSKLFWMGS